MSSARVIEACTASLRKILESGSVRSTSLRMTRRVSIAGTSCRSASFASVFMPMYSLYSERFFISMAFSLAELKGV